MKMRHAVQGFAAVSAILVAATVTSIGTFLAWQCALSIRQTENVAAARQMGLLIQASAAFAAVTVARDDKQVDHRGEPWARGMAPIEMEGARVDGTMIDEQGKFNVNNLADVEGPSEADMTAFRALLRHVGLPESLSDSVLDWIDKDRDVTEPFGAEDAYYGGREPPYRVANRHIVDISELLLVKGFDAERLRRLSPYLTALPGRTKVNVNAASADLLAAILPGVSTTKARAIVAARDKEPFASSTDFSKRLPDAAAKAAHNLLDVRSDYFALHGTARAGRITSTFRALVSRAGPTVVSINRHFG